MEIRIDGAQGAQQQAPEGDALLRDQAALDAPPSADPGQLRRVRERPKRPGDGQGGVHVSPGPARHDQHAH
jgi:hypothetical protein